MKCSSFLVLFFFFFFFVKERKNLERFAEERARGEGKKMQGARGDCVGSAF